MTLSALPRPSAPAGTSRPILSRVPAADVFDAVASAADLKAVMEFEGRPNDRLVAPRLGRSHCGEWVHGRPNARVAMGAFLHAAPGGLRQEIVPSALTGRSETDREYRVDLGGEFVDVSGTRPEPHDPDASACGAPQRFGEAVRAAPDLSGIRYGSVGRPGHETLICPRPLRIRNVCRAARPCPEAPAAGEVVLRRLDA
jgi:hypothetical protein